MFKHKEDRLTFMEEDLVGMMNAAGFRNVRLMTHWVRRTSIKNWLENSGLSSEKQAIIMGMHRNMDDLCRRAYNMVQNNGDCLIDMKFAIVTGEK